MRSKTRIIKALLFLFSISVFSSLYSRHSYSSSPFFIRSNAKTSSFWFADTTQKKDRDKDGIADSLDKCPDEKGAVQYDGCPVPDTDNDGVADDADNCPTIAGLPKYKGCPVPDTDGDKINDEEDRCPTVPGVARYNGCLVADKDGDGLNDDDDKCADLPGPAASQGCPENTKSKQTPKIKASRKSS